MDGYFTFIVAFHVGQAKSLIEDFSCVLEHVTVSTIPVQCSLQPCFDPGAGKDWPSKQNNQQRSSIQTVPENTQH